MWQDFKKARRRYGFDEKQAYGTGIVMLFYGKSGTGKTMLANAVANKLGKRILLINFPSLGFVPYLFHLSCHPSLLSSLTSLSPVSYHLSPLSSLELSPFALIVSHMSGDENLKMIFREAKINDAIIFFDEVLPFPLFSPLILCPLLLTTRVVRGYLRVS